MVLDRILKSLIIVGDLTVTDWHGQIRHYGDGTSPTAHIRFTTRSAARKVALDPDLFVGECYMDGSLVMEHGNIYDFISLVMQNTSGKPNLPLYKLFDRTRMAFRRVHQHNPVGKAKDNVAHHYDLSGSLYDLFLDRDRQYSCAYFESEHATLEDAQLAKKRHLAAKLAIKPGMKVLDIGSGWGGLGLYLAEVCGADAASKAMPGFC
jgi:cyclopropane-fatty-acyl-phospholipid synthase